ncbi:MAG TPA: serine/threonine-protein kinase [Rhodocyclaceae bacterium]|nr:serine/threonine-protein kinase [Rhodocyclaceae bacterium]
METKHFGRYEVLAELGRGAMGVVYKAADPVLNRVVAIKTIHLSLDPVEREEYEARFYQEAKAAGSLSHPAIVTIYDLGRSDNVAYMAMELLEGRELREFITGPDRLPIKTAVSVIAQVADGLAYAHERGIVHRDIKPANIMVSADGTAKITDFGIARMRTSDVQTQTGMMLGSPKYMSPEQVLGQRIDHRADIFSLGITLYETLTGQAPFNGSSLESLMYQTVHVPPAPPTRLRPDLPQILDLILAKALEKKPEDRYQDARQFAADLRECEKHYGAGVNTAATGLHEIPKGLVAEEDKTMVLSSSSTRTRVDDPVEDEDDVKPVGISHNFDSFEATQKLAHAVGMDQEFDAFAQTLKMVRPIVPAEPSSPSEATAAFAMAPAVEPDADAPDAPSSRSRDGIWAAVILGVALVAALVLLFY